MSSKNLEEYFNRALMTNKISHSFIIGNTSLEEIKNELNTVISKYIFKEDIDIFETPDIYIINPSGLFITKDQILEMQLKIQNTSIKYNKKLYIINNSEKLNSYAANSLLKLLEEPENNIYAILITENINNIISTIKSRCQLIFLSTEKKNTILQNYDKKNYDLALNFIKILEEYKENSIAKYVEIQKVTDKNTLEEIFTIILFFYRECINMKSDQKIDNFIEEEILIKETILKNNLEELSKKMLITNDFITKLNYNLNINLLLDKFVIDFGGVKND